MLKKIRVLFLGLVVLAGSACVTPTHASSAEGMIISYIQAAGPGGAKEEVIALHNNTDTEIDITDWCFTNRSNIAFACFASEESSHPDTTIHYTVPAYGDGIVASFDYMAQAGLATDYITLTYAVTSQSSGSIVGSSDTISLIDDEGNTIDSKSWTSSVPTGRAFARALSVQSPVVYKADGGVDDWLQPVLWVVPPQSLVQKQYVAIEDPDPGNPTDPEQIPELPITSGPTIIPVITEVFANPAGSDDGAEFIELYNPSATEPIDLTNFLIRIGISNQKSYSFLVGSSILPNQYVVFYNNQLGFSLVNTSGAVQLMFQNIPMGEYVTYSSPKDDMSWSLIDGEWRYVRGASPGAANELINEEEGVASEGSDDATQKPCASNQYRNPDTGRCRLLAVASTNPTPCKQGQERNAETNRCRNIVTASTVSAPCKAGQERNPETNRCRNVVKMTEAGGSVKGVQTQAANQPSWYYWAAIALIIIAILAYAVWEWRVELGQIWLHVRQRFAK